MATLTTFQYNNGGKSFKLCQDKFRARISDFIEHNRNLRQICEIFQNPDDPNAHWPTERYPVNFYALTHTWNERDRPDLQRRPDHEKQVGFVLIPRHLTIKLVRQILPEKNNVRLQDRQFFSGGTLWATRHGLAKSLGLKAGRAKGTSRRDNHLIENVRPDLLAVHLIFAL